MTSSNASSSVLTDGHLPAAVTAVRSTLLLSSVAAVRSSGHYERYAEALSPSVRDELAGMIAGVWVPVGIALDHYQACDALALSEDDRMRLGRRTGAGLERHLTKAVGFLARGAGITPVAVLEHFPRFWARSFQGGEISVVRVGPKDVELSYLSCCLLRSAYFRCALRGLAVGLLETATRRCLMRELPCRGDKDSAHYALSWV